MPNEIVNFDVNGYELVTTALMTLANTYPGLEEGEKFEFATEPDGEGISIYPTTGSYIYDEKESITGHVTQLCQYPFTAVYRRSGLSSNRRVGAKEWLDKFAMWLEKQPVVIDGTTYVLQEWPDLTDNRTIREIVRQSPAFLSTITEDKSETWIIDVVIRYRNEFDR